MVTRDDLSELLRTGVVSDLIHADCSMAMARAIGDNADRVNSGPGNFGSTFGSIQRIAERDALLATARIYDRPSKRNPSKCLWRVVDHLRPESGGPPPLEERHNLAEDLERYGMDAGVANSVRTAEGPEVARVLVDFIDERLEDPDVVEALGRVRAMRDKRLAHHDEKPLPTAPRLGDVDLLLDRAKEVVGMIGAAYLGIVYTIKGEYLLTDDAERPAVGLGRALRKLGLTDECQAGGDRGSVQATEESG